MLVGGAQTRGGEANPVPGLVAEIGTVGKEGTQKDGQRSGRIHPCLGGIVQGKGEQHIKQHKQQPGFPVKQPGELPAANGKNQEIAGTGKQPDGILAVAEGRGENLHQKIIQGRVDIGGGDAPDVSKAVAHHGKGVCFVCPDVGSQ